MQRADANVERTRQDVSDAALVGTLARRSLETLTGIAAQPVDKVLEDDLHEESPLSNWLQDAQTEPPSLRQASAQVRAAEESHKATQRAFLPTLTASAADRVTNVTGYTGKNSTYTLSATLSWRLDCTLSPNERAQVASVEAARAREDRIRRSAQDQVYESWHRVQTGIAKSRTARAQLLAAERASTIASDRYANGAATQLDVIQAQRDSFAAEVARVQADADLSAARVLLRLNSGRRESDGTGRTP